MKKIKVLLATALVAITLSTPVMAVTQPKDTNGMPSVEQQLKDFENVDSKIKSKQIPITKDKGSTTPISTLAIGTTSVTGSYPTRKGTYLVTDGLRTDSLVGHAGMVLGISKTIESFPSGGVQYFTDSWTGRYQKIWGGTVKTTTPTQDVAAADWAILQKGDPYNWIFTDTENLTKFYCSQLVYKAFKTKTTVNLNYLGGVVTPADLINSSNTSVIYTFTK